MSALVNLNLTQRVDIDLLRQSNDATLRCSGKESRGWNALSQLSPPDWYGICGPPEGLSKQAADAIARFDQDRSTLKEVEKILSECVVAIGEAKGNLYPQVSLEVVQIIDKRMSDFPSFLTWAYKLVCACDPDRASENVTAFKKAVALAQRRARSREGKGAPGKGELLKLEWSDVDMRRRECTLRKMKNGETRVIPMTPDVFDTVAELHTGNDA